MHRQLFMTIGENLPITSQGFKDFRWIIPLTPRDRADNSGCAEDLLDVWQRRGGVSVGEYDELIRVLNEAGLIELRKIVETKVAAILKQIELERRTERSPVEHAPNPPE